MTAPAWVEHGLALLGISAPLVAIAGGVAWFVAKWSAAHSSQRLLQTHKSTLDRDLESHRAALGYEADVQRLFLKRQELMFAREVEAADAYTALFRRLYPKPRFPDADWDDARVDIAERIGEFEKKLEEFLAAHSMAISADVFGLLESAKVAASETNFHVGADTGGEDYEPGQYPSEEVRKGVDEVFKKMQQAFERIKSDLRSGSLAHQNTGTPRAASTP